MSSPMTKGKKNKTPKKGMKEKMSKKRKNSKTDNVMEKKKAAEIINDGSRHGLKAKKKLCHGFQNGNCSNGDKCQFAHDECSLTQETTRRRLSGPTPSSTSMMTSDNVNVYEEPVSMDNYVLSSLLSGLPISPFPCEREKKRARYSMGGGTSRDQSSRDLTTCLPPPLPEPIHSFSDAWDSLVELTRSHPMYSKYFIDKAGADDDRVRPPPCNERCRMNNKEYTYLPQVIALDCEMCMVENPQSGIRNGKELLRLSVVDGRPQKKGKKGKLEPRVTLLDTLVKPSDPIVQMRSIIHGVIEQDLECVEFTKEHGQIALLKLSCPRTVIVGHALHNDLDALRLNHARVVDTSLLFSIKGEPEAPPSLKDVSHALLGSAIQDGTHDSVRRDGFRTPSTLLHHHLS